MPFRFAPFANAKQSEPEWLCCFCLIGHLRGLLRFFRWPAMHVNWLVWCRPLPACKHWPMDLCPSAGDGGTEAGRPTRRLIGGFAGQFSVMPRTSDSTYQWRFGDGFDDDPENFTCPSILYRTESAGLATIPQRGVAGFSVIRNSASRLMAENFWLGREEFSFSLLAPSHLTGNVEAIWASPSPNSRVEGRNKTFSCKHFASPTSHRHCQSSISLS